MRKIFVVLPLVLVLFCLVIVSCNKATMKTTASWVNKEKIKPERYASVFIMVLTENMEAKEYLEADLSAAATARGLKAYNFLKVFGPIATVEFLPKQEVIQKRASELPAETIFTVALVDVTSKTHYVPSREYAYTPYSTYSYYGSFGGYYGNMTSVYEPGYYTTDRKYFLESNLYDVASGDLLMSIQSKAENPESIKKASKQYTNSLIEEISKLRKETDSKK